MNTYKMVNESTIKKWDEGLPLGNGNIGCLIWNKPKKLRFSIDKGGIWDCSNSPELQDNFTWSDMQELVKKGDFKTLYAKYDDCYEQPTPSKLPTGKIIVNLKKRGNVYSELDMFNAVATLKVEEITVKSFVHANKSLGVIAIETEDCEVSIENPKYGSMHGKNKAKKGIAQSLKNLCYDNVNFYSSTVATDIGSIEFNHFVQPITDANYGIIYGVLKVSGKTLIVYSAGIGKDDKWVEKAKGEITQALISGYDTLYAEHSKWWNDYHALSDISLPDKAAEWQWRLNNYLLAACSRKNYYPMPLQGVWTADNGMLPPWKGDYHHDLNTQMSYTSYLGANRLEQGQCFFDFLFSLTERGKEFANKFYNAQGLCMPSVMDIQGHALGGWGVYSLSPTNQLWLCDMMTKYYEFTNDNVYLTSKILPYCKEVGKFILSLLKVEGEVYKLPLSSSPEIHDNRPESFLKPNSNYDLALMHAFFRDMAILNEAAGNTAEADKWREHSGKLEPLAVNSDNVLMLNSVESLSESHRHHSHAMSIYPLRLLDYSEAKEKTIIDATIANLEKLGRKYWVGYSIGWQAQFYAVQGSGDKAISALHDFWNYCCLSNGFHINGDYKRKIDFVMKYRHFTLEGNFIAVDALQHMLLQSAKGKVTIFPAIPKSWKNASFTNLRAHGGVLVSATLTNGIISRIELLANDDMTLEIISELALPKSIQNGSVTLKAGKSSIFE